MGKCIVENCDSGSYKNSEERKKNAEKISFFQFPKVKG